MFSVVIILKPIKIFKRFLKVLKINHYVITGVYKRLWQKKKKAKKCSHGDGYVKGNLTYLFLSISLFYKITCKSVKIMNTGLEIA